MMFFIVNLMNDKAFMVFKFFMVVYLMFCGFLIFIPCFETEGRPWGVVLDGPCLPYDLQWNKPNFYLSLINFSHSMKHERHNNDVFLGMCNLCLSTFLHPQHEAL